MAVRIDRVQVVIPAFNEEATIAGVVGALRRAGLSRIRVVDNGSTDATAARAREAGAEVIAEPRRGYGQACFTGCLNLAEDVGWILFCDADGSDDFGALEAMFAADEDLVLADRRASAESRAALTPVQSFGNALAGAILFATFGRRFNDLGPLRLVRREAYEAMAMEDRGFGWTVEMQARACELGMTTREVPAGYFPRRGGRSKISGTLRGSVMAGVVILRTLGVFWLRRWSAVLSVVAGTLIVLGSVLMVPNGDFRTVRAVDGFLIAAGVMCAGYGIAIGLPRIGSAVFWIVAGGSRLVLLPMTPGTDLWRYVWEGWIQGRGWSPYRIAPDDPALEPLRTAWWGLINHADLTTIYPPLAELVFRVVASLAAHELAFKIVFVAADLGVCVLLARRFGLARSLGYAWCPLVIYCFAGGAHYDSLFVLALVAGWLWWEDGRGVARGALAVGVAFALKYVAAPLGAFMAWSALRRGCVLRAGGVVLALAGPFLLALAFFPDAVTTLIPGKFADSARSADFLPRIWSAWDEDLLWTNAPLVGPFAVLTLVLLFTAPTLTRFAENYFFALFLFSPLIHPWYFAWAIPLHAATRNPCWPVLGVTGFAYFVLERQVAAGDPWLLAWPVWAFLWVPPILAFAAARFVSPRAAGWAMMRG